MPLLDRLVGTAEGTAKVAGVCFVNSNLRQDPGGATSRQL